MSINNRIKLIRKRFFNDSNVEFAKALNKSRQYASNLCNDGKSVGKNVIQSLSSIIPTLDINWLLTGEGNMLKTDANSHSNITITTGGYGKNINASTGSGAISNSSRDTAADTNIITELQAKIKELENELEKRDLIIQGLKNDIGTKDLLISVLMKER